MSLLYLADVCDNGRSVGFNTCEDHHAVSSRAGQYSLARPVSGFNGSVLARVELATGMQWSASTDG